MVSDLLNPFNHDLEEMQILFADMGEKPWRAKQLMRRIYTHGMLDFTAISEFSKTLREKLATRLSYHLPTIETHAEDTDGTQKWLLRIAGGAAIEMVFIPENTRGTLCISSQAGCPLDCSFCATGKTGFIRNLDTAEIITQVWLANRELGYFEQQHKFITNIVFMGMGEPLLNYDNVLRATRLLCSEYGFGLARRKVTVSTAGIVPKIIRLADDTNISLAISLHASNDTLRDQLVPINRHYPIKELLAACKKYAEKRTDNILTIEYVMLKNINDSIADAHCLVKLLRKLPVKINLIPFNPFPECDYECSSKQTIDAFRRVLIAAGLITITRKTRGSSIAAACGQLAGLTSDKQKIGLPVEKISTALSI